LADNLAQEGAMQTVQSIAAMRAFAHEARARGKSLALVPTMGALHEGHTSLIQQAKRQCDVVVVSIFVNPIQFGPGEDYARYPRDLDRDSEILRSFKVDAAFVPSAEEMYPKGFQTYVEPGEIASRWEGEHRPGHFRGVATVVAKLLNIVRPDVAYFGQKDFQQAMVLRRLVEDLNFEVRLVVCPTVREPDGLARSSRNVYLADEDRRVAPTLYRALCRGQELVHSGETQAEKILEEMRKVITAEPRVQLEYIAIIEPNRLEPVARVTAGCVALLAARVGPARLIDNVILGPPGASAELLLQLALSTTPVVDATARIPGLETETLRLKIERCRDCAALSSILLPPREFLVKYLKRDYPNLNAVRVAVVGRDAPVSSENYLYRHPEARNRFVAELYNLLGVKDFAEFKAHCVLTDAVRCHAAGTHVPEKALHYCAKYLREELRLFPNLATIIVLGEDAYLQFQRLILGRSPAQTQPFEELLKPNGWAREEVRIPHLGERSFSVFYCYHPTFGYKRSPSIAGLLA